MRQAPEALYRLVGPVVESLGYELVGIELLPQPRGSLLRVYIDRPGGVTLDDCERVSHQLSGVFEVEEPVRGPYTLEISSPGFDRPLFRREDFERFAGRRVRIRMQVPRAGRRKYTGVIVGIEGDEVVLDEEGERHRLRYADMDQARLVPEY